MTATERITMVVLNDDGSRDKFTLSSWVGIPRKHELMWIGDDPYMIIEVEYAVSEGFFGARSIDAAGVYVRRLTKDEQEAVARRLANPIRGKDVIVCEDIIDTGLTLYRLMEILGSRGASSLRIATLLDKPEPRIKKELIIDYCGFQIPNKFVVGYGLDAANRYRNLPFIGVVKNPDIA